MGVERAGHRDRGRGSEREDRQTETKLDRGPSPAGAERLPASQDYRNQTGVVDDTLESSSR